jgi:FkbM family methyltransferase
MGVESLLAKKLSLPNFFSMNIGSDYGRTASQVFFGGAPRAGMAEIEARIAASTDAAEIERLTQETILFRHPGGVLPFVVNVALNNQLIGASREINEFKHGYEPEIHAALDLLTPHDAIIYDVGANWGPISFQAALRAGFSGRIYSFEPQQNAFANSTAMVQALSLEERMFPQNLAVSDSAGTAQLSASQWTGNVAIRAHGGAGEGAGETCRMVRLDDLSLPDPHLIKIDVEGYERQVIAGASQLLQRARPFVIFEDWFEHPKDHYAQLKSYGYSFYFLGWYNPFLETVTDKPPFASNIQILALQKFEPELRDQFPNRINVLAAPHALTAL